MLTRLEVDGFKNLLGVEIDFGPFTCIAGANGVGKSNVFDAIEFLSALADGNFTEAVQRVRGTSGVRGDPRDLFWDGYRDHERRVRIVAEMLVPRAVVDDLGTVTRPSTTFLRYEVVLGYESPTGPGSIGRLSLVREELKHITKGAASQHLPFPHDRRTFRNSVVTGERRSPFLSTEERSEGTVVNFHGDGGSRGRPLPRALARSGRTFLSSVTTNEYPTILAARREMSSWHRLALEPSALRAPDDFSAPTSLRQDGRHLAATLFRIANDPEHGGRPDPQAVYANVTGRLSDLTGVGVRGMEVELDQVREAFTLFLEEKNDLRLPARALSEGTLRFLALCVLLEDPEFTGLMCMEEPENGIHPANLPAVIDLVRDLAVDPRLAPDTDNPFRQVIINTHSPGVVQLCDPQDLLLADVHWSKRDGQAVRGLSLLPFQDSWRARKGGRTFSPAEIVPYLTEPPGARLGLPLSFEGS